MRQYATADQFAAAYLALGQADQFKLRRYADKLIRGTSYGEPDDLLQEAVTRAVAGVRIWPLDIPVNVFIRGAMRSLAHAHLKSPEANLLSFWDTEDESFAVHCKGKSSPSAEDAAATAERGDLFERALDEANASFSGDPRAAQAVESVAVGLRPREACDYYGMDMKTFRAARKRGLGAIRARLDSLRG